jgi:inorganic triphosphatase YgiF
MTRNPRGAMQPVSVEFELKLSSRSEDLAALYDSSFIFARARGQPSDRCLKTAYYDTADQGLHRAGMTLRVRCEGQTFVQTLKTDSLEGGPMHRREWQAPLPTMALVPSALADRLPKALRSALGTSGLRPVFTPPFDDAGAYSILPAHRSRSRSTRESLRLVITGFLSARSSSH